MTDEDNPNQPRFMMVQQDPHELHQLHEMQMMEMKNTIERFIDELTAEHCIALMRLLQMIHFNPTYLHMMLGQLSALVRIVHKVCASCGDTKHSTMEHISATGGGLTSAPADFGFLAGLSEKDQLKKLNVQPAGSSLVFPSEDRQEFPIGSYECRNCDLIFATLFDRASLGKDCPKCLGNKNALAHLRDDELQLGDLMTRYGVAESYTQEDGVFCLECDTEFPTLKHRINQGRQCPVCMIAPEVNRDEGSSGPTRAS